MQSRTGLIILLLISAVPPISVAAELKPATLAAWKNYVDRADTRARHRLASRQPLASTDTPAQDAQVRGGEILATPLADRGVVAVPDGLIHDWVGSMFVPGATLEDLFSILHDYDHYRDYFAPTVADSKSLSPQGAERRFSMLWRHKVLFVDAAVEGDYEACDFQVDDRLWYSISAMTRVQEIENYGQGSAHLLPPDQGNGFLWRLHSIARYEERDGGVYVELEAIALTRNIPFTLRWLVTPLVARLSRDSLVTSLRQTRDAVESRPPLLSRLP